MKRDKVIGQLKIYAKKEAAIQSVIKRLKSDISELEQEATQIKNDILIRHSEFNTRLWESLPVDEQGSFEEKMLPFSFYADGILVELTEDYEVAGDVAITAIPNFSTSEEITIIETIGSRITQLRKAKGWSQSHLAGVIEICTDTKITQQSIQQIESGETKNPRHLEDFATALDVSEKYLRFGED